MGNPWFRRWVGAISDPKIAEAAMIAETSRSVVNSVWDAILESASETDDRGAFSTTPRRIAAVLCETPRMIEAVFSALTELGMIKDGVVSAWEKRQPPSESRSDASERQRRSRAAREPTIAPDDSACHNMSQNVTPPESESETETELDDATRARAPIVDPPFEAECRKRAGNRAMAASPDFSPVWNFLRGGGERDDVFAALAEIAADSKCRVKYWSGVVDYALVCRSRRLVNQARVAAGFAAPGRGPPRSVIAFSAPRSPAANAAACTEFADDRHAFAHLSDWKSSPLSRPALTGSA